MDKIIAPSSLTRKEYDDLTKFFGVLPIFILYRLNNIKELQYINNKDLLRWIELDKPKYTKYSSFFVSFKNINYIILGDKDDLAHEVSHLVFKNQLDENFINENEGLRRFIDEIIAEYNSFKINKKSRFVAEINRGVFKNNTNIPYHIGLYLADSKKFRNNKYTDYLDNLTIRIKEFLKFTNNEITLLNIEGLKSIFKI